MAIALVNATAFFDVSGDPTIASDALAVSAGNLIVVVVNNYTAGPLTVTGITDTAGNTYVIAGVAEHVEAGSSQEIWYAKNTSAHATNIVTATFSGTASFRGIAVAQFSGCDTSSPYDQASAVLITASGTTHTCTTTGTTAQDSEVLVVGVICWSATRELTDGTGTIAASNATPGNPDRNAIAYRLLAAIGTHNLSVTSDSANTNAMKGATFKAAAATGNPHYAYAQQ